MEQCHSVLTPFSSPIHIKVCPEGREAHERNDEALDRIYIGRRIKNDTEWLDKLFDLYTQMSARQTASNMTVLKKATKHKKDGGDP